MYRDFIVDLFHLLRSSTINQCSISVTQIVDGRQIESDAFYSFGELFVDRHPNQSDLSENRSFCH